MDRATADALIESAEDAGIILDLHPEYSGRGMYGRTTAGVSAESVGDLCRAYFFLGLDLGRDSETLDGNSPRVELASIASHDRVQRAPQIDKVGTDVIAY